MTNTTPWVYYTDHPLSKTVSKAVLAGTRGYASLPDELHPGPAICYGILRGTGNIIRRCYNSGQDFYHIDHGYLKRVDWGNSRSIAFGYFRVTKNALSVFNVSDVPTDSRRFDSLGIQLPDLKRGSKVVVCELTDLWADYHPWLRLSKAEFTDDIVSRIKLFTDREVIVKTKNVGKLSDLLPDTHCVVCHSSNAAVEAALSGVPAVTTGESILKGVGPSLEDIDNEIDAYLWENRRYNALCHAANNQYTLNELSQKDTWGSLLGTETWDGKIARNSI